MHGLQVVAAMAAAADRAGGAMDDGGVGQEVAEAVSVSVCVSVYMCVCLSMQTYFGLCTVCVRKDFLKRGGK